MYINNLPVCSSRLMLCKWLCLCAQMRQSHPASAFAHKIKSNVVKSNGVTQGKREPPNHCFIQYGVTQSRAHPDSQKKAKTEWLRQHTPIAPAHRRLRFSIRPALATYQELVSKKKIGLSSWQDGSVLTHKADDLSLIHETNIMEKEQFLQTVL